MNEEQTKLYYDKSDIKTIPDVLPAKITSIVVKTSIELFKEKAKNKDQKLFVITFNNEEYNITGSTNFTYFEKGKVPNKSTFGKFIGKYEKLEEGMEVKITQMESPFWQIFI